MSVLELLFIATFVLILVIIGLQARILIRQRRTPMPLDIRLQVFAAYTMARARNCILAEAPPYLGLDDLASFLGVSHSSISMKGMKEELYRVYPGDIADTVERLLTGDVWSDQVDAAAGGRRY